MFPRNHHGTPLKSEHQVASPLFPTFYIIDSLTHSLHIQTSLWYKVPGRWIRQFLWKQACYKYNNSVVDVIVEVRVKSTLAPEES